MEEYTRRLSLVRKTSGLNQKQFAKRLGIRYKSWNHYENGHVILTVAAFTILRSKVPGLSFDWLLFGDPDKLARDLLAEIMKADQSDRNALGNALVHGQPLPKMSKIKRKKVSAD